MKKLKKNHKKNGNYKNAVPNLKVMSELLKIIPTTIAQQSLITMLVTIFCEMGLDTPYMSDYEFVSYLLAADDYDQFEKWNINHLGAETHADTLEACEDCFNTMLLNQREFIKRYKGYDLDDKKDTFCKVLLHIQNGLARTPEKLIGTLNEMSVSPIRSTAINATFLLAGFVLIDKYEHICA